MGRPGRKRSPKKARAKEPHDWLSFVEEQVQEMEAATEILRRLDWAVWVSALGLPKAPGPCPGWTTTYKPRVVNKLVEGVLLPEELVARLTQRELRELRDYWASEIREWGQGIWERRGDTLRLRRRRRDYLSGIESLKAHGDPDMSDATAARILNQLNAEPGRKRWLPNGAGVVHFHVFTDPFGNPLPLDEEQRLLEESVEERSERPEDDRALRRIVDRSYKKASGGVHDLDSRLLRSKGDPDRSRVVSALAKTGGGGTKSRPSRALGPRRKRAENDVKNAGVSHG